MLTAEKARELFHYDPETGALTWRISRTASVRVGQRVGHINSKGYHRADIDYKTYSVPRIIWLYVHGSWPDGDIDHINCVRGDNRLANLREVPSLWNQQNKRRARSDSKTGLLGVQRVGRKFRANIQSNRKTVNLGYFATKEEAHQAYVVAKRQMHEGCTL